MTNATNEELAERIEKFAASVAYSRGWALDYLNEAARRVRLLDEYVPRNTPPTPAELDNWADCIWYSAYSKRWSVTHGANIRACFVKGDLWLPLPKVQE